jgi:hypothetical protein
LGTPSSGTVTNLTGTASININGTVGATTPTTGAFTTGAFSSTVTTNGITVSGNSVAVTGSGFEISGGATPNILAYNRTGSAFLPINLRGLYLVFSPNDVERMRIHNSGGVSIGNTTDPGATNLSVTGTITSAAAVTGNALYGTDGTTNARIIPSGGISYWGNTSNHPMYFQTNNAVRMAISAAGGVSIGNTTDPGATNLSVTGNITASTVSAGQPQAAGKIAFSSVCNGDLGSVGMEIQNTAANPLGTAIQFRGWNSSSTGSITTNVNTTNYNTSSDYRLKNITGKIQSSGEYIDSLNPVEGTWKDTDDVFVGLIAHEAQSVSRTQIVFGQKDGEEMQSMSYSSAEMIANIIAELQSLRKRVLELEAIK